MTGVRTRPSYAKVSQPGYSEVSMEHHDIPAGALRRLTDSWHNPAGSGRTFCIPPNGGLPNGVPLDEEFSTAIRESETGAFLFWSAEESQAVLPPFPIEAAAEHPGWTTDPLRALLDKPRTVLVVLLRLSGYAVGVYEGERLARSKVGSRFVKGRHKKGGSSSGRFARRREEQARELMDKAAQTLQEQAESWEGPVDHFLLGGDRLTLLAFEKRCPYMERFEGIRLPRVLNVGRPNLEALRSLPRLMYASRVIAAGRSTGA